MSNLSKIRREYLTNFLDQLMTRIDVSEEDRLLLNEVKKVLDEKRYGLIWEEHSERVDEELQTQIPVFYEDEERRITADPDASYNFLLEGDNLHSLYLLEKTHRGRIDVIYIDPPYNTGNKDFKYDDRYVEKENDFIHSKWLSFMYNRLEIAKNLLCNNGFIFISIDDNEFAQLKLLCDRVFGESNFINFFVWQRNSSAKTEKGKYTTNVEYILFYAKTENYHLADIYKPLAESSRKLFNKDDNDGRGKYQTVSLQKPKDPGPETSFDYVDNFGKIWKCPPKGWRMTKDKIKLLENDNRLVFGKTLRVKDYWNERVSEGKRADTLWNDLPETAAGSRELLKIIGVNDFNNPKPYELIQRCIKVFPDKNATILDFFAGSGTTGHAVMQLNKEDGGNRKYILCTNNENNICEEITYQRLKNIQAELPHNLKYYKTGYVSKSSPDLYNELQKNVIALIELENACFVDHQEIEVIFTDEQLEAFLKRFNTEKFKCSKVYISSSIFRDASQMAKLKEIANEVDDIPEYYFKEELFEGGY